MTIYIKSLFFILISFLSKNVFAWNANNNILWLEENKIKSWTIWFADIPNVIVWAINFTLNFAAAIAIIFVIIWAYKLLFWYLEQDSTKWRDTIIMAISWFAIAILAKFIVKIVVDNFW